MFKWAEIGLQINRIRYDELSAIMNENNFANSVEYLEIKKEDFQKSIEQLQAKCDGIRVGRGLGEEVLKYFVRQSMMAEKIRAADAIVKRGKDWWLESNAVDGFSTVLRRAGEKFILESSVLIVGCGAAARVAVTSLFMAGFKNFSISDYEEDNAKTFVLSMKNTHLGAKFSVVPRDGLILLPGTHGVLVNTTPLDNDNKMLEELYYFNFFIQGGLAIDFTISPVDTPLMKAATDVGAHCLYGYQISAATDLIWAEQVAGRKLGDPLIYESRLKQKLSV
jgi:shikimate 5-dehydrogenase